MSFDLHGAPGTFQRMMDELLVDCTDYAAAYLDDVIIHSTTWEDHITHICSNLQKLRRVGITIKPTKCQSGMRVAVFLGHVVGNCKICPEKAELQAVVDFPTLSTKKQARTFLRVTGNLFHTVPRLPLHSRI